VTGDAQGALLSPVPVLPRAAERLAEQFTGMVNDETVERVVFESYTALAAPRSPYGDGMSRVA
jgi:arsenate reductase